MPKYRVLYAVTRGEYYEVEAATEQEAEKIAFCEGTHDETSGQTTDVVDCEVEEIEEFTTATEKYTVIGVYSETGQVYAEPVEASDPFAAMSIIANRMQEEDGDPNLEIVAAIKGNHYVHAPCEDSGKTAAACDMVA